MREPRDDLDRSLLRLIDSGMSDRELAEHFGKTRNAIIGWRHRLGVNRIQRQQRRETVEPSLEPQIERGAGVEPAERFSGPPAPPPAIIATALAEQAVEPPEPIDLPALPARPEIDRRAYQRDYRAKRRERLAAIRAEAIAAHPPTKAPRPPLSTIARPVAMPRPAKKPSENAAPKPNGASHAPKPTVAAISIAEKPESQPADALIDPIGIRKDGKITVFELKTGICHFPMWHDLDPTPLDQKFYCGAASGQATYCAAHKRRMGVYAR